MGKRRASISEAWLAALEEIDQRGPAAALDRFEVDEPSGDPAHRLWRAEMLVYLDRLDDAAADAKAAGRLDGPLEARRDLILAEIELWKGMTDKCEQLARATAERAAVQWPTEYTRALALIARSYVRRGRWIEAQEALREPLARAEDQGLAYTVGILLHANAYIRVKRSDFKGAGRALEQLLAHHAATGDRRWEGMGRQLNGLWLQDLTKLEIAAAEFERAIELAQPLGLMSDELWARHNLAQLYIARGRYDSAVEVLLAVLDWERSGHHGYAECNGLISLAFALRLTGKLEAARRASASAVFVAGLLKAPDLRLDAALMSAWCEPDASRLRELLEESDRSGTTQQRFKARLMLADHLVIERPEQAHAYWTEASYLPDAESGDAYAQLMQYVRKRMNAAPVRIGPGGELIIDFKRNGWPRLTTARDTVERWLLLEAMAAAGGNGSEAARKLEETRSKFHDRWRVIVEGRPARPVRGEDKPDDLED